MRILRAETEAERLQCFDLRRAVFMREQGVTAADEWDGLEENCHHFLTLEGDRPVATARLLPMGQNAKLQRIAVIRSHRGSGLGQLLMRHVVGFARDAGFACVILDAQTHAIGFYEALGFRADGPEFDDAGIPHRRMTLTFG